MATREKLTRRELEQELKTPDPFFEAIADAREYLEENRNQVLAVGGAVLAAAVLIFGAAGYYSATRNAAATDFANAVANLEFDSPTAAESSLSSLTARSNTGAYGALGALYKANLAAESERYDEAVAGYDGYLASASTPYLKQVALMGKGYALERAGKEPDAAVAYDAAAAIEGPYTKPALSDRARLAEKAGDKPKAVETLRKLLELEGSGAGSAAIEQRLQALQGTPAS